MPLERFSAAWREGYVTTASSKESGSLSAPCVFCQLAELEPSVESGVIWHTPKSFVTLNAFPYGSGHLLVLPRRHVAPLSDLDDDEYSDFFLLIRKTVLAIEKAYGADGLNVGLNLGQAAGAGIPQHLHGHVLPRWSGDTNFMTTIGETRVLPESLESTWHKVRAHFAS